MSQRPFDPGRRDSLGRRIEGSEGPTPTPHGRDALKASPGSSGDQALADHLAAGRECVDLAADFVERYSYQTFMSDPHVQNSGSMLIIRLREVANRLPQQFKDDNPHIPWRPIIGMGNIVAHEYAIRADPDTVWNTLVVEFPRLDVFITP